VISSLEQSAARKIDSYALDEVGRADVQACTEQTAERTLRHSSLCRQNVSPPLGAWVRSYPLGELFELWVAGRLCRQLGGKLTLPARTNAKDDMSTRNSKCNLSAKIGLDHGKREIHSGRYTCRRPDTAIVDMYGVTIDDRRGTKAP
jgi:hypothetical protein